MMPAQQRLASDLNALTYGDLTFPIVHNVDAKVNASSGYVADALTRQVSSPVRWLETVQNLAVEGVTTFVEIGAGRVLLGLVRHINKDVRGLNVENTESLRSTLESL
jgi:[acyl-carrier-protein] S-malonyltransferase